MGLILSDVGNISRAHRLGRYAKHQKRPRPIIVRFGTSIGRDMVWQKRSLLSGTKIWIKEDYPAEVEMRRNALLPYYRAARCGDPNNPDKRVRVYMTADQLVIDRQQYSVDDIESLPLFVKSYVDSPPAMRKSDATTIFFTKDSAFSNFYPCVFDLDNISFNCVEQYLSYKKAMSFDATDIAGEIMTTYDPSQQKQKAKRLAKYDEIAWRSQVPDLLSTALHAKFSQDADLAHQLLLTGDTTIGEANAHDVFYGIGMALHNPNALDPTKWRGMNIQGELLMKLRATLRQQ